MYLSISRRRRRSRGRNPHAWRSPGPRSSRGTPPYQGLSLLESIGTCSGRTPEFPDPYSMHWAHPEGLCTANNSRLGFLPSLRHAPLKCVLYRPQLFRNCAVKRASEFAPCPGSLKAGALLCRKAPRTMRPGMGLESGALHTPNPPRDPGAPSKNPGTSIL